MPVQRYEPSAMAREFGAAFRPIDNLRYLHHTPAGVPQQFQYTAMERVAGD